MSGEPWRQPLDLLRHRRVQRGLPPDPAPSAPAGPLLRRGLALGLVPVLAVSGIALALQTRRWQLAAQGEVLREVPAQRQALETRVQQARRRLRQLERSTEGLARGIVAVQSGSALLTDVMRLTPAGVQIAALQVQGELLQLKGVAVDPEAFRRVNGLQLLLARSPLFQADGVTVLKLSRDKPADPLGWELTARFALLQPQQQASVLASLQADGLARRLQLLQRAGVLR